MTMLCVLFVILVHTSITVVTHSHSNVIKSETSKEYNMSLFDEIYDRKHKLILTEEGDKKVHEVPSNKRTRRFAWIGIFQSDDPHDVCMAGDVQGHCRHLRYCLLKGLAAGPNFCTIHPGYIGICCPDDEEKRILNKPTKYDAETVEHNDIGTSENEFEPIIFRENSEEEDAKSRGCGVNSRYKTKIVGGRPAGPRNWPWMAALMKVGKADDRSEQWEGFCGGVLITDRHVLTAAHCTTESKIDEIRVRLGEYDFFQSDEVMSKDFKVSDIRRHSGYDDSTEYLNDIAILKLQTKTSFNPDMWPICLPSIGEEYENKTVTVIGWGTKSYGGPVSRVLLAVEVMVWSHSLCESTLYRDLPSSVLCAGTWTGGKDACQGDSGGPLMLQQPSGRWTVVGIVSFGVKCAIRGHPGLYTKVDQYLSWIIQNAVF